MNIEKAVAEFAARERREAKASKEKETDQVCLDPDSYMAKEIKYQTALLHQILDEVRKINKKNGNRSSHFSRLRRLFRSKYR